MKRRCFFGFRQLTMVQSQKLSARAASASTFCVAISLEWHTHFMEKNLATNIGGYLASGVATEFLTGNIRSVLRSAYLLLQCFQSLCCLPKID